MTEPLDLERIRAYCEKATAGPWKFPSWDETDGENGYAHIRECDVLEPTGIQHSNDYDGYWHDWRFIQSARTDLPAAIAEIERLRAEVKEAKAAYAAEIASHRRTENLRVGMTQTYTRCTKERDELRQQLRNEQGCK